MAADLLDRLTSDPEFLSLPETEQDKLYEELSGQKPKVSPAAARTNQLESRITERPSSIRDFQQQVGRTKPLQALLNPVGTAMRIAPAALGASQEQFESVTSSPILDLLQGRSRDIPKHLLQGIIGERPVQRGDVARQMGAPEPLAAMFGVATSPELMVPSVLGAKAGVQAGGKVVAGVREALRLGRPASLLKPNPMREQVVRHVQNRLLSSPKVAGRQFERGLEEVVTANPQQAVDLSASLGSYLDKAQKNPAFRTLIERQVLNHQESDLVKSLLNQPGSAANLTLKDSQTLKQIFQRVNKQRFQQVDPEFVGAHLDALEVWHDIRMAQLKAFPQFKDVLKGYAKVMDDFRVIKNALKEGALEPQLLSNFSANSQKIRAFRELATPDTMRMVKRLLKSTSTRRFLKRLGVVGATGVGLEVARRTLGRPVSRFFGLGTGGE